MTITKPKLNNETKITTPDVIPTFFITSAVALLITEFELGTVGSPCSIGFSGFNSGLGTSGFDSDSEGIVGFCSSSVSGFEGVTGF